MVDPLNATCTGLNGTIVRTTNGGVNWITQVSNTSVELTRSTFY